MPPRRLRVVVTRRLPPPVEARLAELFEAELRPDDRPMPREALVDALARADVLVPTVTYRIDAPLLARAGEGLRLIANYGAGVDHIDVASARQRGILVSNTPGVSAEDTADMAMALILSVLRRLPEGMSLAQNEEWEGWAPTALLGRRTAGLRLGVLGMGQVGRAVGRRARAFGMEVLYHTRRRLRPEAEDELGAQWRESLDQMLSQVDVLSVSVPASPGTFHLLNARRLALLPKGAVVVNTSRGEVVDENALTRALRAGELAGAGLDVHERGASINPRLKALPNVVLLPHMASATHEGRIEMGERVIINVRTHQDGHRPPDLVLPGT